MKKSGFTLIEMVVSMAILGVLSGIVAPTFMGYQNKKNRDYSIDLLQTSLQSAFSESRSEIRIFGVKGLISVDGYTFFSCDYFEEEDRASVCDDSTEGYTEKLMNYESDIVNKSSFFIQFVPPHGDIDIWNSHRDEKPLGKENIITLVHEGTGDEASLRIYKDSGFIAPLLQ